jgi:hypothetical protein
MCLADRLPSSPVSAQTQQASTTRSGGATAMRLACVGLTALLLVACAKGNQDPEFGGSVGDGPIIGAAITVTDPDGAVVETDISDGTANYRITVPKDTSFPLLITASGGTDVVSRTAPTFTLLSAMTSKSQSTANINPMSTLIVRAAQCMPPGLTEATVEQARVAVTQYLGFGLDPSLVPHPITTEINPQNVAAVVKANEAVAEMVRRTRAALLGTASEMSEDALIGHLACDLADGTLDGSGESVNPRVVAVAEVVSAQVLLEVLQNRLAVNGAEATAAIDAAIPVAVPDGPPFATTASVTLTEGVLKQTRIALQAALTVVPDASLVLLAAAVENTPPGSSPEAMVSAIPSGATGELQAAVTAVTTAGDGSVLLANQRVGAALTAPPLQVSFSSNPTSVQPNGHATLEWNATNATACAASGAWSGLKPVSGTSATGLLTDSTGYDLVCAGPGGTVTKSIVVDVVVATPAPAVSLSAAPTSVDYNGSTMLSWSASNANTCSASGGWSGPKATSGGTQTLGSLTSTRTFSLTCSGDGGSKTKSVTVTVAAPPVPSPTVSVSVSPSSVAYNGSTTLTWSASNASSCNASGGWSGSKSTSGSQTLSGLTVDRTYTLNCTGTGGSASDSASVAVAPPPRPTVSLTASPSSVAYDGSSTLSWSTSDATSCSASGDWSGSRSTSGSQAVGNLTSNKTYTLSCSGPGGSRTRSATVTVGAPASPTVSLTASPSSVAHSGSTTLNWSATNATSCSASGAWSGGKGTSGNQTVNSLTATSTFTLSCTGVGGSASDSAVVTVAPPDAIPTANDDSAQTPMGAAVDINVLSNDTGLNNGPITVTVISAPANGSATVKSGGVIGYTPAAAFAGQDSLSYRVRDTDGDMSTATVTIDVTCANCAAGMTVTVSWNPNPGSEGVTGYKVFHGSSAAASNEVSDVSVSTSGFDPSAPSRDFDAWNDLGLYKGNQTCFRVKAYNGAGISDYSQGVCTTL